MSTPEDFFRQEYIEQRHARIEQLRTREFVATITDAERTELAKLQAEQAADGEIRPVHPPSVEFGEPKAGR